MTLTTVVTIVVGLGALLAGRQLFWLFVGAMGFVLGLHLATGALAGSPEWMIVLVGVVLGIVGALLAVFFQMIAVGVSGFLAGAYIWLAALRVLERGDGTLVGVGALVAGVLGAILALLLLDWALIVLSSLTGAALLIGLTHLGPVLTGTLFVALVVLGLVVQASRRAAEPPAAPGPARPPRP